MKAKKMDNKSLDAGWLIYNYDPRLYKSYFHPIYAPDGQIVTADSPAGEVHHRGLCISWGNVNGVNFWAEEVVRPEIRGRIVHKEFIYLKEYDHSIEFMEKCDWLSPADNKLLDETRLIRIYASKSMVRTLDVSFELCANNVDVVMDTPPSYHGLCYRASDMQDRKITNSEGCVGEKSAMGVRARWADLSGILDNRAVGVTIFDSPKNPRFPTKFFTMDNAFGFISTSFSYDEPYTIRAGDSLKLDHRILIHSGSASSFDIENEYKVYTE